MLAEGQRFDRYLIDGSLGQGGMGHVYRAFDERLDRHVALKLVQLQEGAPNEAELHARLLREARAAAKLDHPNAVVIYDVGEEDGTPFIAMELVEGRTLREIGTEAPVADRVRWLGDAARALGHAHERGLVHRDVKPDNVMVRDDGRVKVLDFGIARRLAGPVDPAGPTASPALPTLTKEGTLIGTTRFMSPEQIRGRDLDGRSDQFSWGVTAYELLSGRSPWKGDDALALAASVLTDEPPPLSEAPARIAKVVMRCLAKDPADRFATMKDVVAALESDADETDAPPPPKRARVDLSSYSTREVSQILRRAIDLEHEKKNGLSREDLVEVAAEVGVQRDVLLEAVQQLDAPRDKGDSPNKRQLQQLKRHAATYAAFGLFFMILDLSTSGGRWFWWPLMGWGIGLAMHAVRVVFPVDSDRNGDESIERGVKALASETRRRLRVDAPRLRVGEDAEPEDDVAEESALEPEPRVARRED